jgi:tRNA modification GTPase
MNTSTIAAIATPIGRGGIGIIKISGDKALSIAGALFRPSACANDSKELSQDLFKSHRIYHGHIIDNRDGQIVDEVLLSVMRSPRSYTREDVVEINAHAGIIVQRKILELVIDQGARLAEPGEFTKRGFLNGRIDLTQAEGIIDIINARTEKALEIANRQVKGGLGERIAKIRAALVEIVAELEAGIDFPDDMSENPFTGDIGKRLRRSVLKPLGVLLAKFEKARYYREGVTVAVVGRPNVGKSSLVNRLLQKDRVIVTPISGTTRDIIEEPLDINGIPVMIADTAGLQKTEDPVEAIGMEKTRGCIRASDIVFFLIDAGNPLSEEDFQIFDLIQDKASILVVNKIDLLNGEMKFSIPGSWKIPSVMISALYDQGIEPLKAQFSEIFIHTEEEPDSEQMIPNLRHKYSLELALQAVESGFKAITGGLSEELIVIDLKQGIRAVDEITGTVPNKTVLDEIFSRFCIGK